jgi:hypothetical protein
MANPHLWVFWLSCNNYDYTELRFATLNCLPFISYR